ncbi:MAG: glycosyltransferase family 4 protein [Candidatus Diapherotrites archaeon]|nr:glycosyltransferase family 4 protein [Candidatus Diapherotrites archaeon]
MDFASTIKLVKPAEETILNKSLTRYGLPQSPILNGSLKAIGVPYGVRQHYCSGGWSLPSKVMEKAGSPDIIQVEFPYLFEFAAKKFPGKKIVLSEHNVELDMQPIIAKEHKIRKFFYAKIEEIERNAVQSSDAIVTVSAEDGRRICRHYSIKKGKIIVCPNGADTREIVPATAEQKNDAKKAIGIGPEKKVILFCGSKYAPNNEAVRVIEQISKSAPREYVFLIVGQSGLHKGRENKIVRTGYVPDIKPYFQAADLAINPVLDGGGSNVKMFEYMAAGLPIVSTPVGRRGIEAKNGKHLVLSEEKYFAENIELIASDENLCDKIGKNARRLAEQKYDWEKTTYPLVKKYRQMLKK